MGFTLDQLKVLAIIPHVTGAMSVIGSSYIIVDVLRDRSKWKKTYNRLLFAMSCFDCVTSGGFGFSTLPIPKGTPGVYNPRGTTATCTVQGFFIQMSIIGPMYNMMLALYYYLMVNRRMSEGAIAAKVEVYMHAFCWISAFTMGFILLGLKMYNTATLWCWQNDYPSNCEGSYGEPGPVPCERGKHAWLFRWVFYYGLLWVIIAITTLLMTLLYRGVRQQELKMRRYDTRLKTDSVDKAAKKKAMKENTAQSRRVLNQAMFFMGAFILTFLAGSINRLTQLVSGKSVYGLLVLHCVFAPWQGFLNALVYIRPKFLAWYKSRNGDTTDTDFRSSWWRIVSQRSLFSQRGSGFSERGSWFSRRGSGFSRRGSTQSQESNFVANPDGRRFSAGSQLNEESGEKRKQDDEENQDDHFSDKAIAQN